MKSRKTDGFTLLEVVIALAILALQISVLLQVQASSLARAAKTRDMTIATMLARAKLMDIEIELQREGFVSGEHSDTGNFSDEGHPEIRWESRVVELQLDLSLMNQICGLSGEEGAQTECDGLLGALGAPLQGVADEIGQSMRLVELDVRWPDGRAEESIAVRTLMTREDLNLPSAPQLGGSTL